MMVGVYDLKGKKVSAIELPKVFDTEVRGDLIKRAVISLQSHRLQAYGPNWFSGKDTSAFSFGTGRGLSKIPRVTGGGPARGRGSIVPQAVGGRRAHPPVTERVLSKKINKKERILATASAIAATASKELVESRGHRIGEVPELALVVEDGLEELKKSKEVVETLSLLGLNEDLSRAKVKSTRSGKGKKRGRKYKRRKTALIVVSNDKSLKKAAENIPGIDVALSEDLNPEHLAPGAEPARLTVYTTSALKDLEIRFEEVS
jgi:large subunit ribosomal protein L4e